MSDAPFPPRDAWDIVSYDATECVEGYRSHRPGDFPPGDNRSPAFRWGWLNARKDRTGEPDGFEQVRRDFIRMTQRPQ